MSILTMNLKQLYQRRGLWLVYLMLAFLVWIGVMVALDDPAAGPGQGTFIGLIVLAFLVDVLATGVEIVGEPFGRRRVGYRLLARLHRRRLPARHPPLPGSLGDRPGVAIDGAEVADREA